VWMGGGYNPVTKVAPFHCLCVFSTRL
jgi:hypothetical protein